MKDLKKYRWEDNGIVAGLVQDDDGDLYLPRDVESLILESRSARDDRATIEGFKTLGAHWHLSYDEVDGRWDCLRREDGNITAMLSASSALAAVNAAREKDLWK